MKRLLLGTVILLALGCGGKPPAFTTPDQKLLVKRIQAQIEKKDLAAVEQLCKQIKEMHEKSKLSDEQFKAINPICQFARDSRWSKAADIINPIVDAAGKGE